MRGTDHIGKTYGELTVLYKDPQMSKTNHHSYYRCLCSCGKEKTVSTSNLNRIIDPTKTCGHIKAKQYQGKMATANMVYMESEYGEEGITFDQFYKLSQSNCHYCNCKPSRIRYARYNKKPENVFTFNGLDRMDNTKGHQLENCVPCCWTCNEMKKVKSYDEFLLHIKRIYDNHSSFYSDLYSDLQLMEG